MKTLGNTTLRVSPIGLGLAALARPGYINLGHHKDLKGSYSPDQMEQKAHSVLDAAWNAGVRYFDVARSYGKAELFLSSWLKIKAIDPQQVTVASKWGYTYTADWKAQTDTHEVKEHSLERLQQQFQESCAVLGDQLDVYYIHSATKESGVLENEEVLKELFKMSQEGLAIGLTVTGAQQAETIQQALRIKFDNVPLFKCVQATWNLLEQSAGAALAEAHDQGVGVVIKEVVANGRLTARNDDPSFAVTKKILEREALAYSTTIDALCIAASLEQSWVDVVLSGATTLDQLHSNLSALQVKLNDESRSRLNGLVQDPNEYWKFRSKMKWN